MWAVWSRRALVAGIAGLAMSVQALTPAQQLVERMAQSSRSLSYKGFFTYQRGQQASSYRIVHWADGEQEKQRLVFLDGPAREVINDGHSLKCLHSGDVDLHKQTGHLEVQAALKPLQPMAGLLQSVWDNYSLQILGSARVASRAATRVRLNPKDNHRYPFEFFVDDETGLMLKMRIIDGQGQLLERFQFVNVEFGPVNEQELLPQVHDVIEIAHSSSDERVNAVADSGWRLGWVPGGFHQERSQMHTAVAQTIGRQVYMFSDGLSAFSVFVEQATAADKGDTSTQVGSTSAISHVRKIRGARFLVTVVGEIPIMTAKQIALSVEPGT